MNNVVQFTSDKFKKMSEQRADTYRYADWIQRIKRETTIKGIKKQKVSIHIPNDDNYIVNFYDDYLRSSDPERWERMKDCLSIWRWDLYRENKIMDLQEVRRCRDRWCPNCRRVARAKAIQEFLPKFTELRKMGYTPYLLTLTVPNVSGKDLDSTIKRMTKAFSKFKNWFSYSDYRKGYKDRFFQIMGGIRALEITKSSNGTFHPHFHILVFGDGQEHEDFFKKVHQAEFSDKRKTYNYCSDVDFQVREMWYRAYNNISLKKKNIIGTESTVDGFYISDIRELISINGNNPLLEVFKYTIKDTDIQNYDDFKCIFLALDGQRIRQGFGLLYNFKCDDVDDFEDIEVANIKDWLKVKNDEMPERIATKFNQLLSQEYHDYVKISRFNLKFVDD